MVEFVIGFEGVDFQIKTIGKEWAQGRGGAEGEEAVGGKFEVRIPKAERSPKSEDRRGWGTSDEGRGVFPSWFYPCHLPAAICQLFGFWVSAFFRISDFGFRICCTGLT